MKPGALWKISVAIAPEAEEAVVELLSGLFGTAPSIYVDVETRETVASVYLPKLSGWTRARRARLAAGLKNIRACGLELLIGICFLDAPRFSAVYLNVTLLENKNGVDQYGNSFMAVQDVSKEDREAGIKGAILGNGKIAGSAGQPAQATKPAAKIQPEDAQW